MQEQYDNSQTNNRHCFYLRCYLKTPKTVALIEGTEKEISNIYTHKGTVENKYPTNIGTIYIEEQRKKKVPPLRTK